MNKKELLDNYVKKYETPEFIKDDPIQFPHRFELKKDAEISGLIASCLAYGRREKIIESIEKIHKLIENEPYNFCINYDYEKDGKIFDGFLYRYTKGYDIALLFNAISKAIEEYQSLENLFMEHLDKKQKNIKLPLTEFVYKMINYSPEEANIRGLNFLLPSPLKGSACKRLNLYLKWMVRQGPVDLNLWKDVPPSMLLIPLDTHVARLSRKLNLTSRKADDWITTEEITEQLKKFDSNDPVKYDFALFGIGVSGENLNG